MANQKIECPKCGSKLRVWLDLDASVSFEVSKVGNLSKRSINAEENGDCRCGVECTSCSFKRHNHDEDSDQYMKVFEKAGDMFASLKVSLTRPRT